MSVVLRCPNCGTTRATPGECEACHEAQVRYFCTTHSPGLWLAGPTCPTCGATFGAAPAPPRSVRPARPAPERAPEHRRVATGAPAPTAAPASPPYSGAER